MKDKSRKIREILLLASCNEVDKDKHYQNFFRINSYPILYLRQKYENDTSEMTYGSTQYFSPELSSQLSTKRKITSRNSMNSMNNNGFNTIINSYYNSSQNVINNQIENIENNNNFSGDMKKQEKRGRNLDLKNKYNFSSKNKPGKYSLLEDNPINKNEDLVIDSNNSNKNSPDSKNNKKNKENNNTESNKTKGDDLNFSFGLNAHPLPLPETTYSNDNNKALFTKNADSYNLDNLHIKTMKTK